MLPQTLTLLVTYQCTAACDQCCFACHPGKKGRIPQPQILSYITQAAGIPSVRNVVFSGGECFLLGADLVEAIECASSRKLATRCVTNGYWARSPEAARRRLQRLVRAGLTEINFSTGDYHQEYVPVERVRFGSLAAYELGLGLSIMVETRQGRHFTKDSLLADPLFAEVHRRDPDGLRIQENVWIPMEEDRTIEHDSRHHRNRTHPEFMKGCRKVLSNMVITPDEDYVVCCGLTMDQIPELHIAKAYDAPLADIAARADRDILRRWIRVDGPERIIEYLQSRDPSITYSWDRVHPCEACRDLHHRADLRQAVTRYIGDVTADILIRYQLLEASRTLLGDAGDDDELDGAVDRNVMRSASGGCASHRTASAVPLPMPVRLSHG